MASSSDNNNNAAAAGSTAPHEREFTFRSFNAEQGKFYANVRPDYAPLVYQTVVDQHKANGGQFGTLVDVGCGPGQAARALAHHFDHVYGLDPSEGMIETARAFPLEDHQRSAKGEAIRFEVTTAEELGSNTSPPILADGSVDLIVASNAAHWFEMAGFWKAALRVLKPGGNVALWTSGEVVVHPSVPNAEAIEAMFHRFREEELKPYYKTGNWLVLERYATLPLPWTLDPPMAGFDKPAFFRKEWQPGEEFVVWRSAVDMDVFEKISASGSTFNRWRQAHPGAEGTEQDLIRRIRREVERLLHEAGVEPGKEEIRTEVRGAVIVIKKNDA